MKSRIMSLGAERRTDPVRIDPVVSTLFDASMRHFFVSSVPVTCLLLGGLVSCAEDPGAVPSPDLGTPTASANGDDAGVLADEETPASTMTGPTSAPLDAARYPGDFILFARTNFSINEGGAFGVPANHFFNGEAVQLTDELDVAFRLTVTDGLDRALYAASLSADGDVVGSVVYRTPAEAFLGQLSMNASGQVAFELRDVPTPGVFLYDPVTALTSLLSSEPYGVASRSALRLFHDGGVGFRASFATGRAHIRWREDGMEIFARERGLEAASEYAFLFSPGFNDVGDAAGQVRFTTTDGNTEPDAMVLWVRGEEAVELARDVTRDPSSSFAAFDATAPSINARRQVAFVATLVDGVRGVFLAGEGSVITLASTAHPELDDIEPFGPDLNDDGHVAFRAMTPTGRAIFVADGKALVRVVGEHDLVPTDLGTAKIDEHLDDAPVFDGPPKLNRHGDVAFLCALTPPDDAQTEWGTGVFVARAARP
ncbi:MAG: DUF7453 family protein [Myxococcota bacterium]